MNPILPQYATHREVWTIQKPPELQDGLSEVLKFTHPNRGFTYPYQATLIGHDKGWPEDTFCMVLKTPHKERMAAMPCWVFDTEEEAKAYFIELATSEHYAEAAKAVLENRDKAHEQATKLLEYLK